jgi:hypothetical protein
MIVIGIMIALAGLSALALSGRGSEGVALANAQTELSSLVGAARAQAALHQTTARLIVYAQMPTAGDAAKYLRSLQVVRAEVDARGNTVWVAAGDYITLPAPICVVPPSPVPVTHLNRGVTWNNNVATGPVSTLTVLNSFNYVGQSPVAGRASAAQFFGTSGQSGRVFYLEFDSTGTVTSPVSTTSPTKIALTTAVLGGNTLPLFNNANGVRGLFVRKTGAISQVDDATGF